MTDTNTIRVFIGCAANHEDAESQAVLEYTLRKHASQPVLIEWMKQSRNPVNYWHGWDTSRWATPFSGFRWAIPAACGFEGRAIYMDSDVIVMADIAELWNTPFQPGKSVIAKGDGSWRFCVSLWDCAGVRASLPEIALDARKLRAEPLAHSMLSKQFRMAKCVQSFDHHQNWNCLDGEGHTPLEQPVIKAIHYTSMSTQPHLPLAVARLAQSGRTHWFDGKIKQHWRPDLIALFNRLLKEAEQAGYTVDSYCQDPIFGDYIKASLKHYQGGPRP